MFPSQMNVMLRIPLLLICLLCCAACESYRPISENGKVPLFPVEENNVFKVLRVIGDVYEKYEPEFAALGPTEGESARGRANLNFHAKLATGKLEDGSTVQGVVLRERIKIHGKESVPGQRQQVVDLIHRMRDDVVATLKSRWKPHYVVSYSFD
jgi:hypothetical protein